MLLRDALEEFLFVKRLAGLSDASISDYDIIIRIFVKGVGENADLSALTYREVSEFILGLYQKPLSRSTVSTYVRNMRIFLRWCYKEYDMTFNPEKIKVPKMPKKLVHIYSDAEIELLFSSVKASAPWIEARNRAMIALMFDSGLRQSEVCGLCHAGIDRNRMILKVTGKGAKDRFVPLGSYSLRLLDEYISLCPYSDNERVFLCRGGHPVTVNTVRLFVNRLKRELPFDLTSHKLRHNFATNYCLDNIKSSGNSNVYDLSILMGHESIETTKRYEHFAHEIIATENRNSHLDSIYGR